MSVNHYIKVKTVGITPSGILYQREGLWTGQVTSYATGDEGWHLSNGTYNYVPPANPEFIQQLDYAATRPFESLLYNNVFGHKFRFTDRNGSYYDNYLTSGTTRDLNGNAYAANTIYEIAGSNPIIIDHLTGLMWYYINSSSGSDWATRIAQAHALTVDGLSSWRMANAAEMTSIISVNPSNPLSRPWNYYPFRAQNSMWTSTTNLGSTANVMACFTSSPWTIRAKTDTSFSLDLVVRNYV